MRRIGAPSRKVEPWRFRPDLPLDRVIQEREPDPDAVEMDVLFVGGGPAGLAGAIELARLARDGGEAGPGPLEIGVLDKASELGEHCLSGAVMNPGPLRELFPEVHEADLPFRGAVDSEAVFLLTKRGAIRLPTPPSMRNQGNRLASICEVVRWMGRKAEDLGVNLFPGYPVDALLVSGGGVRGVTTTPTGLGRDGRPGESFEARIDLSARATVLAEGSRGLLTQCWMEWQGIRATNPQIYALGVKELWEVPKQLARVIHTVGWPLPADTFGGSWIYPMGENLVSLGLVVGLDAPHAKLDVHGLLQSLKRHRLVRQILSGGELLEWGAKTIPEGGFYSIAERRHGEGICVVGDAAGYVDVPSLKGIHYAIQSGVLAARAIYEALKAADTSEAGLRSYSDAVDRSFIMDDLRRTRNMRLGFKDGLLAGATKAGLTTLTGGWFPRSAILTEDDVRVPREQDEIGSTIEPDGKLTFSKTDAVFRAGNRTRDDIPGHLLAAADVPAEVADFYAHLCPAGVYEWGADGLVINAPNCIDCKATDVLGPRWTPREAGSGPAYRRM